MRLSPDEREAPDPTPPPFSTQGLIAAFILSPPTWVAWFGERVKGNFTTTTPILVIGAGLDEIIAPADNRALVQRLRERGNRVAFIESVWH